MESHEEQSLRDRILQYLKVAGLRFQSEPEGVLYVGPLVVFIGPKGAEVLFRNQDLKHRLRSSTPPKVSSDLSGRRNWIVVVKPTKDPEVVISYIDDLLNPAGAKVRSAQIRYRGQIYAAVTTTSSQFKSLLAGIISKAEKERERIYKVEGIKGKIEPIDLRILPSSGESSRKVPSELADFRAMIETPEQDSFKYKLITILLHEGKVFVPKKGAGDSPARWSLWTTPKDLHKYLFPLLVERPKSDDDDFED